tara:strand:- start:701 stop:1120 length:420 start_codon:yes stop_codon:yes gene_type:complete
MSTNNLFPHEKELKDFVNSIDVSIHFNSNEYIPPWNKGLKGVQESCRKNKTGCFSLETRKKMSESTSATQIGEKNPFYGKSHSAETKKKISDANKGNVAWNKGKKMSPKSRKKLSDSCKGRVPWNKGLKYTHNCLSKKL